MRSRIALFACLISAACAPAHAAVPHVVGPGETLWSIAAANNFTTRALAAYNGLGVDSQVVLGSTIQIPSVPEAAARLATAPTAPATGTAPPPMGAYTVRPGDTLSALAAQSRVSLGAIAAMNGLDPNGLLLAGTALKLPTGSPVAAQPSPQPSNVPAAAPVASSGRVTAADISAVAGRNGVPGDLASAIAWQESGFNKAMVSGANARGVMQVMPGTWEWVQANLAKRHLDPASPIDNVGAGVLFLGRMLNETGGDPAMAAAGSSRGRGRGRDTGRPPEPRRYVDNVLTLRSRFR